ncbi:hypothetical protein M2165_001577 [Variovorax sp. TBS-050B]|uniref:hypothetical protein n=1 Tax=Variovorax sp. TBS-050B TaxID=2940551 RepID=UPI0024733A8E|nr:hypothetical protein [Variovorax sp. TBS-050B]MDH6591688.1 hypothetical protein [Variovorax sp. TBS-050B]
MNTRFISTLVAAGLSLAVLPACAQGHDAPARQSQQQGASQQAKPMTAAVQKPGRAGVTVAYRVEAVPQLNRATPVVLQFDGVTAPEGATVRLSADAGLRLQGSAELSLPQGQRTTATVHVVSEREGLAYLNLFVNQGGASSAISIPIQTGTAAPQLKSAGEIKSTPDGERIITMPAK